MRVVKVKTDTAIKRALADYDTKEIQIEGQPLFLLPRRDRNGATWYVRFYKNGRKQRWLGKFPEVSLKDAVAVKPALLAKMLTEDKAAKNRFSTMRELFEWFKLGVVNSSVTEHRKDSIKVAIDKHLSPFFGKVKIHELTRDHIENFFRQQSAGKSNISSTKKRYSILKQILIKAKGLDLIESNILDGVKVTYFTTDKAREREGRLKKRHIHLVCRSISECGYVPARVFNWFCFMYGTRLTETRKLKWREVDFIDKEITLLSANVKNRVEHVLPMTPHAFILLHEYRNWQKKQGYLGEFVFPFDRGHISKSIAENYVSKCNKGMKWTAHDYRKIIQPMLIKLGVNDSISERIVNHKMTSIYRAYNQEDVSDLMLNALCKWHDYLEQFSEITAQNEHKTQKKKIDSEPFLQAV